jgi:RNA polymerase sigma-70 factor (ECF subfamily)
LRAAVAGEPDAFAEIFRRYYPMIHALAYRLSLNASDAQDIAQETFIKAAGALGSYKPEGPFRNWLYRICANTARDWKRRQIRHGETAAELRLETDTVQSERAPDFDEAREALSALKPDLREAVILIYFEEMSHAEAAQVLGCAEATVSWRIFQAKRKLKKALTQCRMMNS